MSRYDSNETDYIGAINEAISTTKPRFNQPKGFSKKFKRTPIRYACKNHVYDYYDLDWEYEGIEYNKGYYDEKGNFYDRILFRDKNGVYDIEIECEFCGKVYKKKTRKESFKCEGCGANLSIVNIPRDEIIKIETGEIQKEKKKQHTKLIIFFILGFIYYLFQTGQLNIHLF